ncbi:aminotransferase class-III [Alkaliphilus metalliredigens QYMF]|uniref:Aminotransferase class-III n=1 Tax=Alkaliphilus metalliredigens (strain QYMF) TaxID=293826 RepID=A6TT13_ALKMQ|nr:acetylornithine transaminase [Alkaliphilus metalliredigens]ABR49331.1 aminotransferase class-III [Alkaliphilus metalliredigens QYMF]
MKRDWMKLDQAYLLPTYGRMPVVVADARGATITDVEGKCYLDLFAGLAVNVLGHGHPALMEELEEQSKRFLHISNFFYNIPAIELAEKMIERTFPGKIFFTNSGAESTEAMIKYIHKYSKGNNGKGVVVFENSFHGRTLGALKLTRMNNVQQDFPTIKFPVHEIPTEDIQALESCFKTHQPAAFLFEPISGSGGVHVISTEFMERAQALCEAHGVLFCVDEIQTGIGRTGRLFAYEYSDVKPDLLLFAKGVGGGLPLGGIIVAEKISHYFKPGDHGTTFAPNPLSSSLGRRTLEVIDNVFLQQVREKGEYMIKKLEALKVTFPHSIGDIRGRGLMIGVEILKGSQTLKQNFLEREMLVNMTSGNILRLIPPLVIEKEEIDRFISVFEEIMTR